MVVYKRKKNLREKELLWRIDVLIIIIMVKGEMANYDLRNYYDFMYSVLFNCYFRGLIYLSFLLGAKAAIDTYLSLVFDNLDFLSFFVNVNTLKTVALVAVALYRL